MPSRRWVLSKRARFLAARQRNGLARPLPLDVGEANCQGVTASVAVTRSNIRRAADHADLIFFSEVADVRVALALGSGWDVWQAGDTDAHSDRAGCAIAIRETRGQLINKDLRFGCTGAPATRGRLGIRDRWIPHARAIIDPGTPHRWNQLVAAYHAPPMRWWSKWAGYMGNLARVGAGVAGGDGNKLARAVSVALRRKVRGSHVTGVAVKHWIPSSPVRTYDIGSDHRMSVTTLWPER